jgi:hypothetical protein
MDSPYSDVIAMKVCLIWAGKTNDTVVFHIMIGKATCVLFSPVITDIQTKIFLFLVPVLYFILCACDM